MEFNDNKPIYRQIIDFAYSQVLTGVWEPSKFPSVRELSGNLQVNSRTVLKAMEHLQNAGIIISRRGMGFSLADNARELVEAERKKEFFSSTLPLFIEEMRLLGISRDEIENLLPQSSKID